MKHLILILCLIVSVSVFAQEAEKVTVKMVDGTVYTGTIKEKSEDYLVLTTPHGELKLSTKSIKKIESDDYQGNYPYANPHYTRYFFAPSAKPLEKGDGYYQNLMLFGNFVNFGVTKNFSMGGGMEVISLLTGSTPIFFLTPKLGFDLDDKNTLGTGAFIVGYPNDFFGDRGLDFAGIVFGTFTRGTKDRQFSLGLGYGVADGQWAQTPAVNFSGFIRAAKSIGFVTENYFIPIFGNGDSGVYVGTHGIRILGRKSAFDIGAIIGADRTYFGLAPVPFVGYAVSF